MSLRTSRPGSEYYALLENTLLPLLRSAGLTPDQITLAGLALAAAVPLGFHIQAWVGFALMLASALADSLDGLLARATQSQSRAGAFLDSTLDRISDFFYLLGFWVLLADVGANPAAATLVVFTAFLGASLISYARARGEALGVTCESGLMERGVRTVYLLALALAAALWPTGRESLLWAGLAVFWAASWATALHRVRLVYRRLR